MNKINKPLVSELGGIPVILSFIISLIFSFLFYIIFSFDIFNIYNLFILFSVFLIIMLIAFLGFIDDTLGWKKGISQFQHFLYPIIFSLPIILLTLFFGKTSFYIPLFGNLYIGVLYSFLLVPIAITATTNAFNLLAGYNGLEAGLGIIIFFTISIFTIFEQNFIILIILACWVGALFGFLHFNKFPSRIFPGDIITLVNGVLAGVCAIILNLEILIAFLIILFIIEFIIKAKYKFKTECFGIISKNGIIKPNPKKGSLIHFVLSKGVFTERKLVYFFYIIQILISVISLVLYFLIFYN
ncbi:MAG: hypothetical protein PHR26_01115 [Candidatus ainarchaeum sp.]|nr:hypothetical protein [Candidatus ainarchaeum sp.]MDD3976002.1 hypothetical protein [Candidatus ainarchaeum sp.]